MNKLLPLLAAVALLAQCKKHDDPDPLGELPAATQNGTRAFGCLVNGQAWTPKGNNGTSNYNIAYDPTYAQGTLSIVAYRYGEETNDKQTIGIYSDSIPGPGTYALSKPGRQGATFINRANGCDYNDRDPLLYHRCTLTVTRLDKQAGIVSGTFAFTLYKPGCDSVRVTDGRFDYRF